MLAVPQRYSLLCLAPFHKSGLPPMLQASACSCSEGPEWCRITSWYLRRDGPQKGGGGPPVRPPRLLWWWSSSSQFEVVDPGVDGRIILRWIFRKWDVGVLTGSSWLRIGTGGGHL
jgi:hypothetical protein